jgi:serine-type D-Ala-D-Ala carboxypeptidase
MTSINSPISIDSARLQRAIAVAENAVRTGSYPSAQIAVANADSIILTHTVSHPERAPVRADSIFLLASITKPILATAIMRLVEAGQLLISDPIVQYIPEFETFGKGNVTAWHLLTHTSGLDESPWWRELMFERRASIEETVRIMCRSALRFTPGERFEYNTGAFYILAELITRLSGLPYPEYLRQQIFEPLGMRDTSFDPQGEQVARKMPVYSDQADFEGWLAYYTSMHVPGGGLWSSAADLAAFGQALLRGGRAGEYHLLSPSAIDMMTRLHTAGLTASFEQPPKPAYYGLGWDKPEPNDSTLASSKAYLHGGATGTLLFIDPEWDLVFVFLTNQWGIQGSAPNKALNAVYSALRHI